MVARLLSRVGASVADDGTKAVAEIRAAIDQPGMKAVLLFCSPSYDLGRLGREIRESFPCPVVSCTSAGQIGRRGYERGGITAVSIACDELTVRVHLIEPLSECQGRAAAVAAAVRPELEKLPAGQHAFGLLLADGLSFAEERLASVLYRSLNLPIVGGSAGDDLSFLSTRVYFDGEFREKAAVLATFETSLPFKTLKIEHVRPTEKKLVTTSADPSRRLVHEINGLPAAEAYAEALGLSVNDLDASVFSEHPLMLRLGSSYYVRSIAKVGSDGSLSFFCAIEEGLVLTVGECRDPLETLERSFRKAESELGTPSLVIGCDCILRRLEFEKHKLDRAVGDFFAKWNVVGFSTYGEQYNGVHVNQTFTGIALGG